MVCQAHRRIMATFILVSVKIHGTSQHPAGETDAYSKAAYKSGEYVEIPRVLSLDMIKNKLKDSGIFDWTDSKLTLQEKEDLRRLFSSIEISIASRNRQPSSAQNIFSAMRLVERALKKQLKEGNISDSLANKFNWGAVSSSSWREKSLSNIVHQSHDNIKSNKNLYKTHL